MTQSKWVVIPKLNPTATVRLLCLPYAGGSAAVFHRWSDRFSREIEVCAVQLPGRSTRLQEAPFTSMPLLVEALASALHPYLDKPFAMFGYGMGALIGFELARYLRKSSGALPNHLFVGGRQAPQIPINSSPSYNLPEQEFISALAALNGTPTEVLESPELMELILPLLRADFELAKTYIYRAEPPLDALISAYGGQLDAELTREGLEGWSVHTSAEFKVRVFPGDHFFLHTKQLSLIRAIESELAAS